MADQARPHPERVKVAVIGKPHGVRGLVRVRSLLEDADLLRDMKPLFQEDGAPWRLEWVGRDIARLIDGSGRAIDAREDAVKMMNRALFAPRGALPALDDEEYYHGDLVGMAAFDEGDAPLGVVAKIHDYGAGTSLELEDGRLVPFTKLCVPDVDVKVRRLTIAFPGEVEARSKAGPEV